MANDVKQNETETKHEANRGNKRQATEHDNTRQNKTSRDETEAAAPTAKLQGGGERARERRRKGGGSRPVQASCGPGCEAPPT